MSHTRNFSNLFDHTSEVEHFAAGDVIYREGDEGHTMYVVKEGRVDICYKGNTITTLHEGEIFGEMALIEGHTRIASVKASTPCVLIPIDQRRFHFMVTQTPRFATDVMAVMADRIKLLLEHMYDSKKPETAHSQVSTK
jgi:CRP/FNR family transcriptional regulator, cyclic AMP receptor protein